MLTEADPSSWNIQWICLCTEWENSQQITRGGGKGGGERWRAKKRDLQLNVSWVAQPNVRLTTTVPPLDLLFPIRFRFLPLVSHTLFHFYCSCLLLKPQGLFFLHTAAKKPSWAGGHFVCHCLSHSSMRSDTQESSMTKIRSADQQWSGLF